MYPIEGIQLKIVQQDRALSWGSILENAGAQALAANGFELYYFNQKNLGKLDFVIEEGTEISLLKMKSRKDFDHHPALNAAMKKNWKFKNCYVFCPGNVETKDGIRYLPWYMIMF